MAWCSRLLTPTSSALKNLSRTISVSASRFLADYSHHSPDYYAVLGVSKAAKLPEIKMAYFRQAKKFHPDANPGEEAKWMFELAAEAYDVLSSEEKRKVYDDSGGTAYTFGGTAGGPGRPRDHLHYDSDELFRKIFGEASSERDRQRREEQGGFEEDFAPSQSGIGSCKEYVASLTFEEAARGVKDYYLDLLVRAICPKCRGGKSELGYTWQVCVYCEGTGIETQRVGHVLTRKTCSYCDGTRQFHKYKCNECEGTGQTVVMMPFGVDIPPGLEDGQVLKVPIREDILKVCVAHEPYFYLYVRIEKDDYFVERDDLDLYTEADLSVGQAVLGGELKVRGLHQAEMYLDVEGGTGSHETLCRTEQGIARTHGGRKGCHFVRTGIGVSGLSERQRAIWRRFAQAEAPPENGAVDGVATEDSHRYEVGVIEAAEVKRPFRVVTVKPRQSDICGEPEEKSFLSRIFG